MNRNRLPHIIRLLILATLTLAVSQLWAVTPYPLNRPLGLALDAQGNLYYVANYGTDQILIYSPTGIQHTKKTLSQSLRGPTGIGIDSQGNVYCASLLLNAVIEYNPAGQVINVLEGEIATPWNVAVDATDNVWVNSMDVGVSIYSPVGVFLGFKQTPLALSLAAHGAWYVIGDNSGATQTPIGEVLTNSGNSGSASYPSPSAAQAMAFDAKGTLYIAQPTGEVDTVNPYTHATSVFLPAGSLTAIPYGMAVDVGRGRLYLSLYNLNQVQVYSLSTKQLLQTIQ